MKTVKGHSHWVTIGVIEKNKDYLKEKILKKDIYDWKMKKNEGVKKH